MLYIQRNVRNAKNRQRFYPDSRRDPEPSLDNRPILYAKY